MVVNLEEGERDLLQKLSSTTDFLSLSLDKPMTCPQLPLIAPNGAGPRPM